MLAEYLPSHKRSFQFAPDGDACKLAAPISQVWGEA